MKKEIKLDEEYKNRTLFNKFDIKDLVDVINHSPTLLDSVPFELYTNEEKEIIRDLLEEVAYKTYEIEMKNKEIIREHLTKDTPKIKEVKGKNGNLKVIEVKASDKKEALDQLKKVLPKDIYDRIKKEI